MKEEALNSRDKSFGTQAIDVACAVLVSGFVCQLLAGTLRHMFSLSKANSITLFLLMFLPVMVSLILRHHFKRRGIDTSLRSLGWEWRSGLEAGAGRRYKMRMSRPMRLLTGGTGLALIVGANTAFLVVARTGYWNGLFTGSVGAVGIALMVWWMSE